MPKEKLAPPPDPVELPPAIDAPTFRIDILERRLQNPFGEPSVPIHLKDPSLLCRWFNSAISANKMYNATETKGWAYVTPAMVVDLRQIGGHELSVDGKIVRGERGREYLMCMPRDAYDKIQKAKSRYNNELMQNPHRQTSDAIEAGSKAGLDPSRSGGRPIGQVQTSYERIAVNPELE